MYRSRYEMRSQVDAVAIYSVANPRSWGEGRNRADDDHAEGVGSDESSGNCERPPVGAGSRDEEAT